MLSQWADVHGIWKRQVRSLSAQLRMAAVRRSQGLAAAPAPQHLVFAGPPGTGKTTVARIVGKIFAGLGLLERGHVVEAQRVDLVGQRLGETAIKTSGAIDRALDGVLFIDEAYALSNTGYSGGDAFGKEALQVLLKRAEDDRHRLVVVLAGYPNEIAELLSTNPGLASRFNTRVDFPSYAADELALIAESFLAAQGGFAHRGGGGRAAHVVGPRRHPWHDRPPRQRPLRARTRPKDRRGAGPARLRPARQLRSSVARRGHHAARG